MKSPLVTVVMSVYNGLRYLPSAVDCILDQTFNDFEFIIIDDGSTDGASQYLDSISGKDQRIQVLHQENRGLGISLNSGFLLSKGKYIARMDSDDITDPQRLALQIAYMESRPEISMCSTGAVFFDGIDRFAYSIHQMPDKHELLASMLEKGENPFVHGSVMMRSEAYKSMNEGYRLNTPAQDFDLWLRMCSKFKFGVVQNVLYGYRVSYESTGIGSLARKSRVTEIILQLHNERRLFGKELTDWKTLTSEEEGYAKKNKENKTECDDVAKYAQGLHWLSVRKYGKFHNLMKKVSTGKGLYSKKAKTLILLYPVSLPLWWLLFHLKKIKSKSGKFIKIVKPNMMLPDLLTREFNSLR